MPPREPAPTLPLDLLTEMEFLFASQKEKRRDSFPNSSQNSEISLADKAVSDSNMHPKHMNVDVSRRL